MVWDISASFYYLNSLSPDKWSSIVCVTREYASLTRFKCRSSQTYNFVGIPNNINYYTHDEEQKALLQCALRAILFIFFLFDLNNPVSQSGYNFCRITWTSMTRKLFVWILCHSLPTMFYRVLYLYNSVLYRSTYVIASTMVFYNSVYNFVEIAKVVHHFCCSVTNNEGEL